MESKADVQIRSVLSVADRMITISERGLLSCQDDGCLLLNGMVRECAYRLRDAAERERELHRANVNRSPPSRARPQIETDDRRKGKKP